MAALIRYDTPNVYRAVVAWYYVAPGVPVFLAGQLPHQPHRGSGSPGWASSVGLRSRLPTWPLSPTADGPCASSSARSHHLFRRKSITCQSDPAPEWLTIPERRFSVYRRGRFSAWSDSGIRPRPV